MTEEVQELRARLEAAEQARDAAQDELLRWRQKYEFLFSNIRTGYAYHRMVLDDGGTPIDYVFLEVNDAFEELTGLKRADLVGRRVTEVLPGIEQGEFDWIGTYGDVAMQGTIYQFDQHSAELDRWYSVTAHSPERGFFVVVFHEITQLKRTEAALREKEEQLRQAQKMEAVGRLAGGIAHDFNNLITVIGGYADVVRDRLPDDSSALEPLVAVRAASDRAASLCGQLLAFSRHDVIRPQPIDLGEVTCRMASLLDRLLGGDVSIDLELPERLGTVLADRGQVEQLLMNLAVNARDAMPSGGRLTIRAEDVEIAESLKVCTGVLAAGEWVRLSMIDTGSGIPEETIARIFEPFFTTKEVGAGTGLGLSTVYGIVKGGGGEVEVRSELGLGTTFEAWLPRIDERPMTLEVAPVAQEDARGVETILVAEDDEAVLGLTSLVLRDAGYEVLEASGGSQAMLHAVSYDGPIHLLLSDMLMRDTTGPVLIEQVQEQRPETAALLMSGYFDPERLTSDDIELPLLRKPFSASGLRSAVRQVLDASPAG